MNYIEVAKYFLDGGDYLQVDHEGIKLIFTRGSGKLATCWLRGLHDEVVRLSEVSIPQDADGTWYLHHLRIAACMAINYRRIDMLLSGGSDTVTLAMVSSNYEYLDLWVRVSYNVRSSTLTVALHGIAPVQLHLSEPVESRDDIWDGVKACYGLIIRKLSTYADL